MTYQSDVLAGVSMYTATLLLGIATTQPSTDVAVTNEKAFTCRGKITMNLNEFRTEEKHKLGPSLVRRLFESQVNSGFKNKPWLVLLRLERSPQEGDVAHLEKIGFHIRSAAGDVLTGTVCPQDLKNLVALESVIYVEASEPLSPEQTGPNSALYD